MSLVIDSLKKIKSTSPAGSSVPPNLLNLAPSNQKKGPNKVLLVILVFVFIGAMIIFFMPTGSDYKVQPPVPGNTPQSPVAAQPQPQQAQPTPPPAQQTAQATQTTPQQPAMPVQQQMALPVQNKQLQATQPIIQKGQYPVQNTTPEYDPSIANRQRLAALNGLPVTNAPQQNQRTAQKQAAVDNGEETFNAILQQAQNQGTNSRSNQPAYPQPEAITVQKSNPAFTLTGKQKQAYIAKVNYNTLTSNAADALDRGNNRKAEDLFAQAMSERPNRSNLSGLLTAKIRQGEVNSVQVYLNKFSREADSGVICAAAMEMAKLGRYQKALALLSQYGGRSSGGQMPYTAGVILESAGNNSGAEASYAKALKSSPSDPYTLYAAARNKDVLRKYDEAVILYRKIDNTQADDDLKQTAKSRAAALSEYLARQNANISQ